MGYAETTRNNVLALADEFERLTGKSYAWVSQNCYGNGTFLREFKARRRSVSVDQLDSFLYKLAKHWPIEHLNNWPDMPDLHFTRENLLSHRHIFKRKSATNRGK
jgi:hypothetical protein